MLLLLLLLLLWWWIRGNKKSRPEFDAGGYGSLNYHFLIDWSSEFNCYLLVCIYSGNWCTMSCLKFWISKINNLFLIENFEWNELRIDPWNYAFSSLPTSKFYMVVILRKNRLFQSFSFLYGCIIKYIVHSVSRSHLGILEAQTQR